MSIRIGRGVGMGLAVCMALVLAGCTDRAAADGGVDGRFTGPAKQVGNGTARTYVLVDGDGAPTEVGIRMSEGALDGLVSAGPAQETMLDLPEQASRTVFDHVTLNWNPHGHAPDVLFGKPHFDMHFYMTDPAAVQEIDRARPDFAVRAARLPEPKYVPQNFVAPPGPAEQNTEPAMGLHWADLTAGLIPGAYDFQQIFINGSWDGEFTFMEPMITREWLQTKPTMREDIKQPAAFQRTGLYPTVYTVNYDASADEYVIALGGMTQRQAS